MSQQPKFRSSASQNFWSADIEEEHMVLQRQRNHQPSYVGSEASATYTRQDCGSVVTCSCSENLQRQCVAVKRPLEGERGGGGGGGAAA